MQNFYFKILLFTIYLLPVFANAQMVTKQIVIANGGEYSNPDDFVTINVFDPETQLTADLATIYTQSVQGLFVNGNFAFVAAQDSLVKINLESGEKVVAIGLSGVNKFGVYQDKLIVTRQYPVTSGFVQIRNLADLSLIKTFDEISDESYDVIVVADSAYISVTGGWSATAGKLAILDMKNEVFVRETDFGTAAVGISKGFQNGNELLFVCKTPYMGTSGSIIKYNLNNSSSTVSTFQHILGKAAGTVNGQLYLMIDGNIGSISLNEMAITDLSLITDNSPNLDITACALDVVSEKIYASFSYWISPDGTGKIFDLNGNETGQYDVGISSEDLAVNYLDVTGFPDAGEVTQQISVYPNPCRNTLAFSSAFGRASQLSVIDLAGKEVLSINSSAGFNSPVDVSILKPGIYFLRINVDEQGFTTKFVKQ
jgi:hypothetical protein